MWGMREPEVYQGGHFTVRGGQIVVSDPCYFAVDPDAYKDAQLRLPAVNGEWVMEYAATGRVVCGIKAEALNAKVARTIHYPDAIPVDAGQAGIFCANRYWKDDAVTLEMRQELVDWEDGTSIMRAWSSNADKGYSANDVMYWYSYASLLSLRTPKAGCADFGCCASSGYGDGCYDAVVGYNEAGEAVSVEIFFVVEEDEEEEDYEEEDEGRDFDSNGEYADDEEDWDS